MSTQDVDAVESPESDLESLKGLFRCEHRCCCC